MPVNGKQRRCCEELAEQTTGDLISPLILLTDKGIHYFLKCDLLKEEVKPLNHLWQLPEAERIAKHKKTKDRQFKIEKKFHYRMRYLCKEKEKKVWKCWCCDGEFEYQYNEEIF